MQDKSRRCDGCGAEAWVSLIADLSTQELDFCAHHYQEHSTLLHAQGWTIQTDERHRLINEKPPVSV